MQKKAKLEENENELYSKKDLKLLDKVGKTAREFYNKYYDIKDSGNIDNKDNSKRTLEKK